RPAGPELHLAGPTTNDPTRDHDLDFAPWHAPQVKRLRILARQGTRRTEADIVVTVGRHIPVTVGGTHVHRLIVERAATQHTATRSSPCGTGVPGTAASAVGRYRPGERVRSNS